MSLADFCGQPDVYTRVTQLQEQVKRLEREKADLERQVRALSKALGLPR